MTRQSVKCIGAAALGFVLSISFGKAQDQIRTEHGDALAIRSGEAADNRTHRQPSL